MIRIGIIGEFLKTAGILSAIFNENNHIVKIINYNQFFNILQSKDDLLIIGITSPYTSSEYINKLKLDILIINETDEILSLTSPSLLMNDKSIILINADKKNSLELKKYTPSYIITFGFNSKASVTISSLKEGTYNTVQICFQRDIPTLSNKIIGEQEFSVNIRHNDILPVLAAVITALAANIDIEKIKCEIL